jgi:hypothetical protein
MHVEYRSHPPPAALAVDAVYVACGGALSLVTETSIVLTLEAEYLAVTYL